MPKLYSLLAGCWLAVLALGAHPAAAQKLPVLGPRTCATEQANILQQVQLQKLIPGYKPTVATQTRTTAALRTTATTYTLPVIVHVINDGEAVGVGTNISQAQVLSQLDVLNEDYRNLNTDGSLVPAAFQPLRADMQVQFVPAVLDPSGNPLPEPGIDRVNRNTKGWSAPPYAANGSLAYIDGTIKPGSYWDPNRYINIWVLNLGGGLLGYAQFPDNTAGLGGLSALGGSAATDGVVILYAAFGRVGTLAAPFNKGRTLTHELGHWFGLRHIWGDDDDAADTCSGSDYADDTPNQAIENYGCPTFPHVSCSNGPSGDMYMDYMDYVNDACMQMFSASQKDRLQAVMATGTPRRSILATSNAGCPNGTVAATAANSGAVCPGSTVTLAATGPAGATYAWTGPNGYTSTQQNPVLANITTAMVGVYTVRVSVTTGPCPGLASTTVTLNPAPPIPVLATTATSLCPGTSATLSATNLVASGSLPNENFNGAATGWTLASAGTASTAWQYRTPYTYSSTYVALTNYSLDGSQFVLANSDAGGTSSITNTTLTSPVFSTQGYSDLRLTFLQHLAYFTSDIAVVEASTDGTIWTTVASYTADQGTETTPATSTVDLSAFVNKPQVQVRWRYYANYAYFWAVDNVQFSGSQPTPLYAWSVVSGDGLPANTTTPTVAVSPSQTSVYRLTVSYPGVACTSAATISVIVSLPTWNGTAGNGNWYDARNWTGCVPTRNLDATIPAGLTTPYPTIGSGTAEVRNLVQQGSLTMTGGELALYGNYIGSGTLTASGGTVATRGTGAQSLLPATYTTLLISGTGTKTVGAATVATALNLAGALLSTGAATVTLGPAATITETDASYVLGKVQTTHTLGTTIDDFGGLGTSVTAPVALGATTVVRTTSQTQGTGTSLSISRYYDITATARSLQGATLVQRYLPHELGTLAESQLVMFRSTDAGASWSNEGATQRDAGAHLVSRNFVTDLQGRWTLGSATAPLTPAAIQYTIAALPVPFTSEGLSLLVTTPTAGPLHVRMYDVVGRTIYDHAIANVEVGTSTVQLPNSGFLQPGKYILHVQQANQEVRLNVARGQ
jgi:hypothetical protein